MGQSGDWWCANLVRSNLSFAAWQFQLHGYISNSMIIVNVLHAFYVVDFFINEDWYLRTIDICHDHYGFYLAWGSMVWLPGTYTLQAQYLARYPVNLSTPVAAAILLTGISGYVVFRSVNYQKDIVRRTNGECMIWGKKAEVIRTTYKTEDGKMHESLLLCSGAYIISTCCCYLTRWHKADPRVSQDGGESFVTRITWGIWSFRTAGARCAECIISCRGGTRCL